MGKVTATGLVLAPLYPASMMSVLLPAFSWLLLAIAPKPCSPAARFPAPGQGAAAPADSTEARTVRQGVARRQPAESVEAFVQRVFPASFADPEAQPQIIPYAWRPSPFGRQLFFSAHDPHEYYRLYVFVLDPYQADTYAVERFEVEDGDSDSAGLAALFFADANRDGRKELLLLVNSSVVTPTVIDGVNWQAHTSRYHTGIYGYVPAAEGQRPHYRSTRAAQTSTMSKPLRHNTPMTRCSTRRRRSGKRVEGRCAGKTSRGCRWAGPAQTMFQGKNAPPAAGADCPRAKPGRAGWGRG